MNQKPVIKQKANWKLRRLGFRCYCVECGGRFWQAKYGESARSFRKRYEEQGPHSDARINPEL